MATDKRILIRQAQQTLDAGFMAAFRQLPERYFSAPGRTELGGNHTDHQQGRVLAAAVELDIRAAVRANGTMTVRILSRGYPLYTVDLSGLEPRHEERNSTPALIRGVAAGFAQLGCKVRGFDAYVESDVLPGSGLSSSAAFAVLLGTILNGLFFENRATAQMVAMAGQYAENVFFGKPCGLMDQMASAVGGLVAMDFADPQAAVVQPIQVDFSRFGHALCIIDTRGNHADLTEEYAAIPAEMKAVAACMGAEVLAQTDTEIFYEKIPELRKKCGDRAVLRAMHFFAENARVPRQAEALERGDFAEFLRLVRQSGRTSWMYLQNVIPAGAKTRQELALALALCEHLLGERGAFRVHGGGFAGTVQAFVPVELLENFRVRIDEVLGAGACHVLAIRPQGGVELQPEGDMPMRQKITN